MSQQDEEVVEAINSNEQELEINLEDGEEEVIEKTYSEKEFKQVLARAKTAEAKLKEAKPNETPQKTINNALSEDDIDAKILLSQGFDKELLDEAKTLAKIRNKSLIEIQNDPVFLAIKKEKEDTSKAQKSKLGVSRGSGQVKQEKSFTSPGLSEEEHRAMWRETNG